MRPACGAWGGDHLDDRRVNADQGKTVRRRWAGWRDAA
eukprot:gene12272-13703_t